jgi:hypothetical protein
VRHAQPACGRTAIELAVQPAHALPAITSTSSVGSADGKHGSRRYGASRVMAGVPADLYRP